MVRHWNRREGRAFSRKNIGMFVIAGVIVISGCDGSNPDLKKCLSVATAKHDLCVAEVEASDEYEGIKKIDVLICAETESGDKNFCDAMHGK
tara:strand:+ start:410 stop:685 length:276 start_codon:yes stop_codon:yes gene_type:complete